MANMSHCRFINTFNDLRDCIQALNEINHLDELSEYEQDYAKRMVGICQRYIDTYEDFI